MTLTKLCNSLFFCKEVIERENRYIAQGRSQYMLPLGDARSELTIDGTMKGNLARFLNHSCEPNLRKVSKTIPLPL